MNKFKIYISVLLLGVFFISCDSNEEVTDITQFPRIKVEDTAVSEGIGKANVEVILTWAYNHPVSVDYEVTTLKDGLAEPNLDFRTTNGTITIPAGDLVGNIEVEIIDDLINESNEKFLLTLSNAVKGKLIRTEAVITINNDDSELAIDDTGFEAPEVYQGYDRVWEEDFLGSEIDELIWTHETGGGGWGNNELQYYTDSPTNSFVGGGYLFIEAKEEALGGRDYTSARLISQDKYSVQYGRIDIRAKMPEGKGIWPALWMLGQNFKTDGWPRCGEIDIMELIGNQPQIVHGTAHFFGSSNSHEFIGKSTFLPGGKKFSDEFHVFSIVWKENSIEWQLDGKKYFELTSSDVNGADWPFNSDFFFILNIAVGGNWPGAPNASTVFPQKMLVDYIRVYQIK